jgi:hypothetical protein
MQLATREIEGDAPVYGNMTLRDNQDVLVILELRNLSSKAS